MKELLSNTLYDELYVLGRKAKEGITDILLKNEVESIYVLPYIVEGYVTSNTFFETDKNGYGISLELNWVKVEGRKFTFGFSDNEDCYSFEFGLDELCATDALAVLSMLEELFINKEEFDLPLLKIGEEFEEELTAE